MINMITSNFNDELQILETAFNGVITADDVLDYLTEFKENSNYPRKLKSLTNATHASFKFSFRELSSFNKQKNKSLKKYDIVISAIIIDRPATAAISTLYGAIANNKKYKFKVFSTQEAALIWIGSFSF